MKIGVLTFHRAHNYGAYLQACALCNRLNMENNIDCEIIDFRMNKEIAFYSLNKEKKIWRIIRPFRYKFKRIIFDIFERAVCEPIMVMSKESMVSDSIEEFVKLVQNKYDVIIAGSDEIWKIDAYRGFPTAYWLFGNLNCRKFSYAASSRSDFSKINDIEKKMLEENLSGFEYIGLREQTTLDALQVLNIDGNKVHLCCDPSFLYDFPVRKMPMTELLKGKAKLNSRKRNIVVMVDNRKLSRKIWKELRRDYNLISVFIPHPGYHNVPDILPVEWAEVIKNADLVLTTFFHGTCFSIIYNTPFIIFGSESKDSKLSSLFEGERELRERYIIDTDKFLARKDFKEAVLSKIKLFDASKYIDKRRKDFEEFIRALNRS